MIYLGNCRNVLRKFGENSIDSMVTDPPAGISFMNKSWDSDKGGRDEWIKWMSEVMRECLRVLKPGGHALVWAIPRTSHWTATAIENAGFEVRDVITHLFGSGFPKSLDISKAIDKEAGLKRKVVGTKDVGPDIRGNKFKSDLGNRMIANITEPSSYSAQWQGFGTALKPAAEFWILARKPLSEKTVAKNVLKWGTGGLNIDGSRIESGLRPLRIPEAHDVKKSLKATSGGSIAAGETAQGRFPANLVFSHTEWCTDDMCDIECAIKRLDEQSGNCKTGSFKRKTRLDTTIGPTGYKTGPRTEAPLHLASEGGASRFFYCAKVSSSERNAGLDIGSKRIRRSDARPNSPDLTGKFPDHDGRERAGNHHPTVKPIKLMEYLIRLITPPNGTVLDPFMGSGSTGLAAKKAGFKFIGIEKEKEYFEIAKKRIQNSHESPAVRIK